MEKHSHTARPVQAREYKLILATDRFADRDAGASAFQTLILELAKSHGGRVKKKQDSEEVRRTWYLDTSGFDLRRNEFALRIRREGGKIHKTTLKCRSADRYLAAAHDLGASGKAELKFEEDILPPFQSRFANSADLESKAGPYLPDVAALAKIFPGISRLQIPGKAPLEVVNNLHFHEIFRKLCQIDFGKGPPLRAGASFWYLTEEADGWPVIAEFSFDLEAAAPDDFPPKVLAGINGWFRALQGLPGWFNLDATTKTRFAYEAQ